MFFSFLKSYNLFLVYVLMHVNFFKYKLAAMITLHSLLGMISYGTTSLAVLSHGTIFLV